MDKSLSSHFSRAPAALRVRVWQRGLMLLASALLGSGFPARAGEADREPGFALGTLPLGADPHSSGGEAWCGSSLDSSGVWVSSRGGEGLSTIISKDEATGANICCAFAPPASPLRQWGAERKDPDVQPDPSTAVSLASAGGGPREQRHATLLPSPSRERLPQPWLLPQQRVLSSAERGGNGKPRGFLEGKLYLLVVSCIFCS